MGVNIIKITGPAATGKSTMIGAYAEKLIEDGMKVVRYTSVATIAEIRKQIEDAMHAETLNVFIDDISFQDFNKLKIALDKMKIFDKNVNVYVCSRDRI